MSSEQNDLQPTCETTKLPQADGTTKLATGMVKRPLDEAELPDSKRVSVETPPPPPQKKYLFWIDDCCSYEEEELRALAAPLVAAHGGKTPCGHDTHSAGYYDTVDEYIKHRTIPDVSRTSGDTVCSITQHDFERPYILSQTGRSYSEQAIQEAIERALAEGKDLRLEDKIISSHQMHKIVLYPNHRLGGWLPITPITFGDKPVLIYKSFDHGKARLHNIPEMSKLFDEIGADCNEVWEVRKVFTQYIARRQSQASFVGDDPLFRDIILSEIVFPRYHPKWTAIFQNVRFNDCFINMWCFCGPQMISCSFQKCLLLEHGQTWGGWKKCEFINCTFVFLRGPQIWSGVFGKTNSFTQCAFHFIEKEDAPGPPESVSGSLVSLMEHVRSKISPEMTLEQILNEAKKIRDANVRASSSSSSSK